MLFTSLNFAIFMIACVAIYYAVPKKYQWYILILASFAFYWGFGKRRLLCLVLSALSAWLTAMLIGKCHAKEKSKISVLKESLSKEEKAVIKRSFKRVRRLYLALFLLLNLGMLAVFKFYPTAQQAVAALPKLNLLVPVGISFYTLSVISYIMDVYNKKTLYEENPLKVLLFTMFFPTLIEGPINRFDKLAPQLCGIHSFNYDNFVLALQRILWGYFKKLVIADRLYVAVATIFDGYAQYKGFEILIGAVLYTIQLYADFSGGIDIALGVGELFGISLEENFKRPFFSKNIPEFWRRWHITLGTWLRDYVFYPVTLSKPLAKTGKFLSKHVNSWAGKWIPAYISLFVLWLCNGIWHGDGLQYIAFGLYHGALVVLGMSFAPMFDKLCAKIKLNRKSETWKIISVARTFLLVCIGELIFRSSSLSMAVDMIKNMFSLWNPYVLVNGFIFKLGLDTKEVVIAIIAVAIMFAAEYLGRSKSVRHEIKSLELPLRWAVLFAGVFIVAVYGAYGSAFAEVPFIYFQF